MPKELSTVMSEHSIVIYCVESLIVTLIVGCIYMIRFFFDDLDDDDDSTTSTLFNAHTKKKPHSSSEVIFKFMVFFIMNVLLFMFLDLITPSLSKSIRSGYGYMIGVAIMGILMSSLK